MTNEEKAKEIIRKYREYVFSSRDYGIEQCLLEMAEWKEQQHSVAYVVTRSDMHYDEVEKVFFDIEKAKQYCAGYNNNEDEYSRDITKINVIL